MKTKRDWSKVKDERCECGHLKSQHHGVMHHLDCRECFCSRFTWKYFVDANGKKVA